MFLDVDGVAVSQQRHVVRVSLEVRLGTETSGDYLTTKIVSKGEVIRFDDGLKVLPRECAKNVVHQLFLVGTGSSSVENVREVLPKSLILVMRR